MIINRLCSRQRMRAENSLTERGRNILVWKRKNPRNLQDLERRTQVSKTTMKRRMSQSLRGRVQWELQKGVSGMTNRREKEKSSLTTKEHEPKQTTRTSWRTKKPKAVMDFPEPQRDSYWGTEERGSQPLCDSTRSSLIQIILGWYESSNLAGAGVHAVISAK